MSDAPRLRTLVIGASGLLGRAVVAELGERHDIGPKEVEEILSYSM